LLGDATGLVAAKRTGTEVPLQGGEACFSQPAFV